MTLVEQVARAISSASCPGHEGPFGGYDYGHNREAPKGGRYVIRDFRDPASNDWGKWVHQSDDRDEHDAMFTKMTEEHIAQAAIKAVLDAMQEPSEAMIKEGARYLIMFEKMQALAASKAAKWCFLSMLTQFEKDNTNG